MNPMLLWIAVEKVGEGNTAIKRIPAKMTNKLVINFIRFLILVDYVLTLPELYQNQ